MNGPAVKPTPNQFFLKLQGIVSEITGIDPEDITYGMEFDELSMTPLELAEFFARINKECNIRIKANHLEDAGTLGALSEYIEDELE